MQTKTFLQMRQNLLDSLCPTVDLAPSAVVPVQAVQQYRQRKQVRDAKRRPARRYPHKRIHHRSAGIGLTNRAQRPVIPPVLDKPHPARRDVDQFELTPVKRMKRVRHPNDLSLNASKRCSW